jgi:DNA repair photolyase
MTQRPEREIIEIECKSVLNRVVSQKMPFKWSVNPYRGCEHKCVYCYARRYHTFFDLNPGADFENKIFVKVNAPQVLRQELSRKSWQREHVAIGTAVDPYQPVEGKYRLTRAILKALLDYWTPCSIITKNTMLLRDIDLLSELGRGPGCKVFLSITTLDKALAQRLEPDTPPPEKRLAALSRLVEAGIHAGVMVAPILPGLTDGPQLERLVDEAFRRGARFVQWGVLRLDEGVKEVFYSFLEDFAPRLLSMYGRMYPGVYAPEEYAHRIDSRLSKLEPPRTSERGARGEAAQRRPAATALPASPATSKPPLQLHLQL